MTAGRRVAPRAPEGAADSAAMLPAEFVAVDWGTSRLRLRLIDGSGAVAAERATEEGIGSVAPGGHERAFLEAMEGLLGPGGRWEDWSRSGGDVYFAGMVTSSLGWFQTPYVPVPAGPRDLLAGLRRERVGALRLHFFPGVRATADVLRGEEVEAIGIVHGGGEDPGRPRTLVLPGTHSKWIRWRDGRIEDFATVLTGDLHAALHRATLLSRTLPSEPAAVGGGLLAVFDRGVDLAFRDGPLSALFKARSLPLLEGLEPPGASALVSGILIGGEIAERARLRPFLPVRVGGAPALRDLYLRAFGRLRIPAEGIPEALSARASAEGLRVLRAMAAARRGHP